MSSASSHDTAALVRSCRLVLEMMILTLLGDADSMTTFIATCLMLTNGPTAPCLVSSYQYQLAPSMSGHYSSLVCRARLQSIVGRWLARCVFIERSDVDLKRGETTCKSLVHMK